jgi:putative component of membrane protein insertase Oxa1/YidC/SpoIIIJ protein YidD
MIEAVQKYGIFKGFYLGIKRLSRCQPMCEGGFDPVPGTETQNTNKSIDKNQQNHKDKQ